MKIKSAGIFLIFIILFSSYMPLWGILTFNEFYIYGAYNNIDIDSVKMNSGGVGIQYSFLRLLSLDLNKNVSGESSIFSCSASINVGLILIVPLVLVGLTIGDTSFISFISEFGCCILIPAILIFLTDYNFGYGVTYIKNDNKDMTYYYFQWSIETRIPFYFSTSEKDLKYTAIKFGINNWGQTSDYSSLNLVLGLSFNF